ncbi:MAG: DNA recombination protein RmuC, partial [Myxococcaceae bacterium]
MELVLLLVLGLALGFALGWLVARQRTEPAAQGVDPAVLEAQQARAEAQQAQVEAHHARVVAEVRHAEAAARAEVERELSAALASLEGVGRELAAAQQQYRETIDQQRREARRREAEGQTESKILQQLAPVARQLGDMRLKVDEIEKQRSHQHGQLTEQLRVTHETAAQSKQAAEALAAALSNNSVRGTYGETQLRTLVESAGLLNRIDYSVQESITADSGARRPDMVINLPGGKRLAIDSKVPYRAFIDAYREELDDDRRRQLRLDHARAVKKHVDELAAKQYWSGLETSPEFTIAFIPNEAILNDALDADPGLMEHAYAKGIALATPVNLWATLKTVALTWKQEQMAENARDLVALGRELYKRLGTMSDHVTKLGRSLERTVGDYNKFVGSLERQVLSTARKLDAVDEAAQLGAVPEIEDADPRRLAA